MLLIIFIIVQTYVKYVSRKKNIDIFLDLHGINQKISKLCDKIEEWELNLEKNENFPFNDNNINFNKDDFNMDNFDTKNNLEFKQPEEEDVIMSTSDWNNSNMQNLFNSGNFLNPSKNG